MSKSYEYFGRAVRNIREGSGLSQVEFGKRLGLGGQFISNVERGQSTLPTDAVKTMILVFRKPKPEPILALGIFMDAAAEAKARCEAYFKK